MKRLLSILLFVPVLSFSQYTAIPDPGFEQALIDLGHDDVIDGQVLTANISDVDTLRVSQSNTSDLTGVEDFTALTWLFCPHNQLTSLDVSQNTALTHLYCQFNQLTSLDVSQNTSLDLLVLRNNQLTCLNVKNGNNTNMSIFNSQINPNLTCIEVDDPNWATQNWGTNNGQWTLSTNCNYPAGCFTNSIKEYQSNLSIYPNPTNKLIQIEIENYNGTFEAELYDFTGKLLETTNNTTLSLADYPRGIYLLKVAYGDRLEQLKVVKE